MLGQKSKKITERVSTTFSRILTWLSKRISSIVKFAKASFLSLFFIIVLVLLITQMDQAFTMLIDILEGGELRWDLMITFLFLIVLALALSHYPIYNYYASDLNDSSSFTTWYAVYPFIRPKKKAEEEKDENPGIIEDVEGDVEGVAAEDVVVDVGGDKEDDKCGIKKSKDLDVKNYWIRRLFKVFVFIEEEEEKTNYTKDDLAHYLRYLLGMLILMGWMLFILNSFLPKFDISPGWITAFKWLIILVTAFPFTLYIITREGLKKLNAPEKKKKEKI